MMLLLTIGALIIKKQQKGQMGEQGYSYKILSFAFGFLRSFPLTVFIFVCVKNLQIGVANKSHSLAYAQISLSGISILLLLLYVYISSNCFNMCIPSKQIPWADVSNKPFNIDVLFKFFLMLLFVLRKSGLISLYVLAACLLITQAYKNVFLLRKQFLLVHMNAIMSALQDILMFHLTFFLLFSVASTDHKFIMYVVLSYPVIALIGIYSLHKFKHQWLINNIDNLEGRVEKIIAYQQMLQFYIRNQTLSQYYLYQIMTSHYLYCDSYATKVEDHMTLNIKMKEIFSEDRQEEKPLIGFEEEKSYDECQLSNSINLESNVSSIRLQNSDYSTTRHFFTSSQNQNDKQKQMQIGLQNKKDSMLSNDRDKLKGKKTVENSMGFTFKNSPPTNKETNHINTKRKVDRDKEIKKLVKHYFKVHLMEDNQKDFRFKFLQIYFTLRVLKNSYLAYFQLLELENSAVNDSFMERNIKLLYLKMLHQQIIDKHQQNDSLITVNLEGMLEINQLQQKFDNEIENTAANILKFWQSLIKEKDIFHTFENGLEISQGLQKLKKYYDKIDKKQADIKENKLFIQMAAFYKLILFKQQDCLAEIQKSKIVMENKVIDRERLHNGIIKGMISSKLQFKTQMEIQLINKEGCEIIEIEKEEAIGMKLNTLMPQIVSENHQKFISQFILTGKSKIISKKRELFVKNKQGLVVPVKIFLYINYFNQGSQIIIFESNQEYQIPGYLGEETIYPGLMICDNLANVLELSKTIDHICGLTYKLLQLMEQNTSKKPHIDDLFQQSNQNGDIIDQVNNGQLEFEVKLRYYDQLQTLQTKSATQERQEKDSIKTACFDQQSGRFKQQQQYMFSSFQNQKLTYILRFHKEYFLNGEVEMLVCGIYPIIDTNNMNNPSTNQSINKAFESQPIENFMDIASNQNPTKQYKQLMSIDEKQLIEISSCSDGNHSISSATSSSVASVLSSFNQYANVVNDSNVPKTLRFILQIVVAVFFVVIVISVISLILVMINLQDAKHSIDITNLALERLNGARSVRLLLRHVIEIANGYIQTNDTYIPNRYSYYMDVLQQNLNHFVNIETQIISMNSDFEQNIKVNMTSINFNGTEYYDQMHISQGIFQFANYIQDIINQAKIYGPSYLLSKAVFLCFTTSSMQISSVFEKNAYFVFTNANGPFNSNFRDNAWNYNLQQQQSIKQKVDFSSTISWICLSLVIICGLIIIPLMGRIQNRILELMQIFFNINSKIKHSMIFRINKFKAFQNNSRSIQTHLNQVENECSVVIKSVEIAKRKSSKQVQESSFKKIKNQKHVVKIQKVMNVHNKTTNKQEYIENDSEPRQHNEDDSDILDVEDVQIIDSNPDLEIKEQIKTQNQMLSTFKTYINHKKIIQSIVIMLIAIALSVYFIATYLVSANCFTQMSDAMNDMNYVFSRKSQAENTLAAVYETYIWNKTQYANGGKSELMDTQIQTAMFREAYYQQNIVRDKPVYVKEIHDYIAIMESQGFCDYVYSDNNKNLDQKSYYTTSQICKEYNRNMTLNGISSIYYQIYQTTSQLKVKYFAMLQSGSATEQNFISALNGNYIRLIDTIYYILDGPQQLLQNMVTNSLRNYFNEQKNYFIIMFVIFIAVLLSVLLFFILRIYKKLKKEMMLSNKLLYIIDFELINDDQRSNITKFLVNY